MPIVRIHSTNQFLLHANLTNDQYQLFGYLSILRSTDAENILHFPISDRFIYARYESYQHEEYHPEPFAVLPSLHSRTGYVKDLSCVNAFRVPFPAPYKGRFFINGLQELFINQLSCLASE